MVDTVYEPAGHMIRYYALYSQSRNEAYIGSTEWLIRLRDANHKALNPKTRLILEACDAEYCVFGTSSISPKSFGCHGIIEKFEFFCLNILKKGSVEFVNEKVNLSVI